VQETTFSILEGTFFFVMGLVLAVFHRHFAQWTSLLYFKLFQVKFNVRLFQIAYLVGGILSSLLGLIIAFRIRLEETVLSIAVGIMLAVTGSWFVGHHRQFGQANSDFYDKLFHIRINVRLFQVAYLIGGLFAVIIGLLIATRVV
jgi:hypothetical protein